jgi:hypothetical protein
VNDELDPKEVARIRRRDRDAEAEARALMRPGMGKVFKQILDTQAQAAQEVKAANGPKATRPASKRLRPKPKA